MYRFFASAFILIILTIPAFSQQTVNWSTDGDAFYEMEDGEIIKYTLPSFDRTPLLSKKQLTPTGSNKAIDAEVFSISSAEDKILIFTNTVKVWRLNTRGDYWIFDKGKNNLRQIAADMPSSTTMFAKLSPDGTQVAYVSRYNLYVENLETGDRKALTTDGTRKKINGTFDWAYEEEFGCRDGFRWSPDGTRISFWQVDAEKIPDYYMVNTADSVYSQVIPVEYPTAGVNPSPVKIGVVNIQSGETSWMKYEGDPQQHYIPVMQWAGQNELIVQRLNRKQNESSLLLSNTSTGESRVLITETDKAWVDVYDLDIKWIENGKSLLWISEKDGWRHIYKIARDGVEVLLTPGAFDAIQVDGIDEKNGYLYYTASPSNATQRYLYRSKLNGKLKPEQVTPASLKGSHSYSISTNGSFARHTFSNVHTRPLREWVALPSHKSIKDGVDENKIEKAQVNLDVEFFKITTADNVEMDGWMVKPGNFDPNKKYPVVFLVYTEPAGANVRDAFGVGSNRLYKGDMVGDGYIYMSVDNRGTPAPKGREWRKSVYRKIGILNIDDQAKAAREILKWNFVDAERIAVWGWSGGGSATLNLMFRYPEIYKTGIAIAAVANQLTYDNIYQERYMGLPSENKEDFENGSPIRYAENLEGNLLYIHGTGDDNVHYNNAEMLINELIKHNKQFQFMAYPNRSHSISEGEGTREHLQTLFTNYLNQHCPPGGR